MTDKVDWKGEKFLAVCNFLPMILRVEGFKLEEIYLVHRRKDLSWHAHWEPTNLKKSWRFFFFFTEVKMFTIVVELGRVRLIYFCGILDDRQLRV